MSLKRSFLVFAVSALLVASSLSYGQTVPQGIFYQAVARDNMGKEIINTPIDIKFSVLSGNPLGPVVYQELQKASTSKYGVFSMIIGSGTKTGGTAASFAQIDWGKSLHYLKVEVKFSGSDFVDMGTMQFLSVPYALYAQKSLEPGPAGPKGDPGPKGEQGDPASDNQTLSLNNNTLSISNGNSVPMTSFLQTLTVTPSTEGTYLGISQGNSVLLSNIEGDGDKTNEIQDLIINSDKLSISKNPSATTWDLSKYSQSLTWDPLTNKLGITDKTATVDLTALKDDADASPTNELQSLSYDKSSGNISISSGNSVNISNTVGFKAKKSVTQTGIAVGSTIPFINAEAEFIDGSCYDTGTGVFIAPSAGIYTFYITYKADGAGSARVLTLLKGGTVYEVLGPDISAGSELNKWVTMKLVAGDTVSLTIMTGMSTYSGTGSFLGYRVN
jgi:hypothetical protein